VKAFGWRRSFGVVVSAVYLTSDAPAGATEPSPPRPTVSMTVASPPPRKRLEVLLPDPDNRQFLVFWVALGSGAFARQGLELDLASVAPPSPRLALGPLREGRVAVALLPPPLYLEAFAEDLPLVLVANLLTNDPIALVVRRSVVAARHVPLAGTLTERLRALGDVLIGIAPNPPPRLRALYREAGVPLDEDQLVVLGGRQQNAAFRAHEVDALYAHTPFLETALVDDDAVVVVDQAGGEGAAMRGRTIHGLCVSRELLAHEPDTVGRLVVALDEGAALLRTDEAMAAAALSRALPAGRDEKDKALVHLYRGAIPETLVPTVAGVRASLTLFPATRTPPELSDARLAEHLDGRWAEAARRRREETGKPRSHVSVDTSAPPRLSAFVALLWRLAALGPALFALLGVLFGELGLSRRGDRISRR
jgi:ABC-type nitrate/sulfonate/bicarbonate transport system substrate-binding protein